jgi:hypothetical protein
MPRTSKIKDILLIGIEAHFITSITPQPQFKRKRLALN